MLANIKWRLITENALYCVVNGLPQKYSLRREIVVLCLDIGIAEHFFVVAQ